MTVDTFVTEHYRPHAKMHKSAELALLLQQAGAQGVCVQKVSEAEALAAGGVLDITITNEVIAMPKLHRAARLAAQLAARGGRLGVAVDHVDGIARLADGREQHVFGRRTLPQMDVASASCAIQNLWLAARAEGRLDAECTALERAVSLAEAGLLLEGPLLQLLGDMRGEVLRVKGFVRLQRLGQGDAGA